MPSHARTFFATFALLLPLSVTVASDNLFSSHSSCDSACDGGCDGPNWSCPDLGLGWINSGGFDFRGWVDTGFIGNTSSPNSKFNGPYNAVDRSNELMMNQFYLIAEKLLPQCGHGIGARIDYLYGEDYFLAESIGMEKRPDGSPRWNNEYYGSAIPQAYVSLGNQQLSLQLGHFYSVVGYEGVMAPDNFFYSKSYSYQFAGPFTHWGGMINWNPSQAWSLQLGMHNGWDALDRVTDRPGFIGKVRYDQRSTGRWTSFAITAGDEFNDSAGVAPRQLFTTRTRYSWLIGLPITRRIDYVFHHWLGLQDNGNANFRRADWYGIDQYLYYTCDSCTKAGVRFEWFRDEDGTRVGLNRPSNPNVPPLAGNFFSFSFGVNRRVSNCVLIRPELRADWFDGEAGVRPYDDGNKVNQFMLGLDAILTL